MAFNVALDKKNYVIINSVEIKQFSHNFSNMKKKKKVIAADYFTKT